MGALQKWEMETIAQHKRGRRLEIDRAWRACCLVVNDRDGLICRICHRECVRSLDVRPDRAEHAHLVRRRALSVLRTDDRNVLVLCFACHVLYDRRKIFLEQSPFDTFVCEGRLCLNANYPLWRVV